MWMISQHRQRSSPNDATCTCSMFCQLASDRFFADLENKFGDFKGKRLVSRFTFSQDWDTWEMYPAGEEFVCLLSGQVDLILEQDQDGAENRICLSTSGAYVLIPRGIWHTVKVDRPSSMLFITPGEGTQNRLIPSCSQM